MFTAKFLQIIERNTINATLTHRSRLFKRRAAVRHDNIVTARRESKIPNDTVAPEKEMLLAVVDGMTPMSIQPSVDDLVIAAGVEPSPVMPDAVASVPPFVDNEVAVVIEPSPVVSDAVVATMPSSAPATKRKKRVKQPKTEVHGTARLKRSSRKKSGIEKSDCRGG